MRVLITGGRIIDPANDIDRDQDLYLADGKILSCGRKPQDFEADQTIDATGLVVCPGLVDMRARLREPGHENKGCIESETKAAVKGGITSLCCPPDTDPVIDTPAVVELIHRRAEQTGFAKVFPLGALTLGLGGEKLSEMHALKQAGCVGVSNCFNPVNTQVMRRAMEYAASHGFSVYIHPQDAALSAGGCAHEGRVSVRLGLTGIPEAAETIAIAQSLHLIELTGVEAHFCQISTAAGAALIARAQYDGIPVTADVTAHHLFLTEMDIGFFDSLCHVQPPLRSLRDRDGLRDAVVNGTISAICSDHQPHDIDAKLAPFPGTEPGISGLETLLPLALRLVDEELLTMAEAIARVTLFPANILGIKAGTLDKGETADICIFDSERYWQLSKQNMVSFGQNSPFLGWDFKGLVTHTLLDGKVVYEVDELLMLPIPDVNTTTPLTADPETDQNLAGTQAETLEKTQWELNNETGSAPVTLHTVDDESDELVDLMDGDEEWDAQETVAYTSPDIPASLRDPFVVVDEDEAETVLTETNTEGPLNGHEGPAQSDPVPETAANDTGNIILDSATTTAPGLNEETVDIIVDSFNRPKLEEQRSKIESLISSAARAMSESGHLENGANAATQTKETEMAPENSQPDNLLPESSMAPTSESEKIYHEPPQSNEPDSMVNSDETTAEDKESST